MMRITTAFLKGEVATSNQVRKKILPAWKQQEAGRKQNFEKRETSGISRGAKARQQKGSAKSSKEGKSFLEGHSYGDSNGPTMSDHMANGTNITTGKNKGCRTFNFYMDELCGDKITISIQWDYRKAWSKENSSSPVNGSWNVKVPRPERNTHIVKQQGYSTRMHNGLRTGGSTITKDGRNELCNLLRHNLDIIAWKLADMTGVLRHIEEHRLKFKKDVLQSDKRKGYHQIKMAKEDEEKTAFITSHGIFYYSKIPFGLKNAEATYQRLVHKAFQKQIGRNMEVYVDDLVIKSSTKQEIMRDIRETFKTLKEINMKLNPKKCTFRVEEGMFLGYKGNIKGIKVCPDKLEAVLSLPSLKCLKDVQRMNGKLASLNRFLAKSAKKSLVFYKTLNKCTKKSGFQWTAEAETAFKQMKKLIAELSTLHIEKEELILYLTEAKEATSAVLMTKREAKQMPIYFVHASKRLKSIELGKYDIHYKPRVSIKGQILADFIVERTEDDSLAISMEVEEELPDPWTLFIEGSSCIDGFGDELILTDLEGIEFTYALRFRFDATNNEAEYEALVISLRITKQIGVKNLQTHVDSRLVANQINGSYIAKEHGM
nr:reverse transcriptase domain-containing protein [Tanacetum cinerariifolium]